MGSILKTRLPHLTNVKFAMTVVGSYCHGSYFDRLSVL